MRMLINYSPDESDGNGKTIVIDGEEYPIDPDTLSKDEEDSQEEENNAEDNVGDEFENLTKEDLIKLVKEKQTKPKEKQAKPETEEEEEVIDYEHIKTKKTLLEKKLADVVKKIEDEGYDPDIDKDDEDYLKLLKSKGELEGKVKNFEIEMVDAIAQASVQKALNKQNNKVVLGAVKTELTEMFGDEIDDDVWNKIVDNANKIVGTAKMTKDDVMASAVRVYGYEPFNKLVSIHQNNKVREDIKNAKSKLVAGIGTSSKGSVSIKDMSEAKIFEIMDKLHKTDRAAYERFMASVKKHKLGI